MKNTHLFILIMCLGYIVNEFIHVPLFNNFLSLLTFIVLLLAILTALKTPRYIGLTILLLSISIGLLSKLEFTDIFHGIQGNLSIIVLILLAPFITIPLKLSGYIEAIVSLLNHLKGNEKKSFRTLLFFMFIVTPILNIASIRITNEIVQNIGFSSKFLGKAYVTSFLTALVWSPYFASVVIILYLLDVKVSDYIFIGFLFALIQLLIAFVTFKTEKEQISDRFIDTEIEGNIRIIYKRIINLLIMILLLIAGLVVLEYVTDLPMMLLVSITSIIIPLLWGIIFNRVRETITECKKVIFRLSKTSNEITIFISAGLLASILSQTSFSNFLTPHFIALANFSYLLFSVVILIITMFFSLIGFHQIIIIPLLIIQVNPEAMGMSSITLAFIFILAWCVALAVSPISVVNILLSGLLRAKWWEVGLKWNGIHLIFVIFTGLLIVICLQTFY